MGTGVNIQCSTFDVACQEGESVSIIRDRVVGSGTSLIDSRILCDGFAQLAFPVGGITYPPIASVDYILNLINRAPSGNFVCT
jgi:hypothetical protein